MEFVRMSLVRMTGLIALSVAATTLQADARPLPAEKPDSPARKEHPGRDTLPVCKPEQQSDKRELILVIAPTTSAWSESGHRCDLDGSGSKPTVDQPSLNEFTVSTSSRPELIPAGRVLELTAFRLHVQVTRPWLAARYPHAPPCER